MDKVDKKKTKLFKESSFTILRAAFVANVIHSFLLFIVNKIEGVDKELPITQEYFGAVVLGSMFGIIAATKTKFYKDSENNLYSQGNFFTRLVFHMGVVFTAFLYFKGYTPYQLVILYFTYSVASWYVWGVGHLIKYKKTVIILNQRKKTQS